MFSQKFMCYNITVFQNLFKFMTLVHLQRLWTWHNLADTILNMLRKPLNLSKHFGFHDFLLNTPKGCLSRKIVPIWEGTPCTAAIKCVNKKIIFLSIYFSCRNHINEMIWHRLIIITWSVRHFLRRKYVILFNTFNFYVAKQSIKSFVQPPSYADFIFIQR